MVNRDRLALAAQAARLYPGATLAAGTDLLSQPGVAHAAPVKLARIALNWAGQPQAPRTDATAAAAAHLLPQQAPGGPFPSYAAAVAVLHSRPCSRTGSATGCWTPRWSIRRGSPWARPGTSTR